MHNLLRILLSYAPQDCIEQYSVDECFIDVSTVAKNFDEARNIAAAIKRDVRQAEKLMVSAGISYNKTFAKLATKFKKPDGLTVITQNDKERLYKLSVKKIWGIGRRIERRLNVMNIITIGDLANTRPGILKKEFGVNGLVLRRLARGEDTSEIFRRNMHEKCLNHNHTLSQTVYKPEDVRKEIRRMGEYICRKLRTKELVAGALFLTLRYWDLRYAGDDIKLKTFTNDDRDIYEAALSILPRFPVPSKERQVRMFGIGVFNLHTDNKSKNLELFNQKIVLPYTSLDKLKYKYGENIIRVGIAT
jgi:DNA polymerase-4